MEIESSTQQNTHKDTLECQQAYLLNGHLGSVTCIRFSPNGKYLASSSADGTIKLWDTDSWIEVALLEGHQSGVNHICWSNDNRYLASCSDDKTVRLWDVENHICLRVLEEMKEYAFTMAYHPRNTILATAGDEYIYIWETHTGTCLYKIQAHNHCISSLSYSADGSILISSSLDGLVRLWDVKTGSCLRTVLIKNNEVPISNATLTPNSKYLLISTKNNIMYLYNIFTDKCIAEYKGHQNTLYCSTPSFLITPQNQYILTSGEDSSVYIFNVKNSLPVQKIDLNKDAVIGTDCHPFKPIFLVEYIKDVQSFKIIDQFLDCSPLDVNSLLNYPIGFKKKRFRYITPSWIHQNQNECRKKIIIVNEKRKSIKNASLDLMTSFLLSLKHSDEDNEIKKTKYNDLSDPLVSKFIGENTKVIYSQNNYLLVLIVYMRTPHNNNYLFQTQKLMLYSLSLLPSSIKVILYTKVKQYTYICDEYNITYYTSYTESKYHAPLFIPIISSIQKQYKGLFYGYIHGELLVSNNIDTILTNIYSLIESGIIQKKVFLSGLYYSHVETTNIYFELSSKRMNRYINRNIKYTGTDIPIRIDYFMFSAVTLSSVISMNKTQIDSSLGRILFNYVSNRNDIDTIDITNALIVFHPSLLSEKQFYDVHRQMSLNNLFRLPNNRGSWSIHNSLYTYTRMIDDSYYLYSRGYFDDTFDFSEISLLQQYINKNTRLGLYLSSYSQGYFASSVSFYKAVHFDYWKWNHISENVTNYFLNSSFLIKPNVFRTSNDICSLYYHYYQSLFSSSSSYTVIYIDAPCIIHILSNISFILLLLLCIY
ncbi:hypothetical protein WA158_007867 [Blastocystis sp. Blastoise]